jgi:hypothetical protein
MIRRTYFYRVELVDDEAPQTAHGLVTITSWRADPLSALNLAMDGMAQQFGCPRESIRCEAFNAV